MKDKVSIIIPVYNVEPYIRQCLDSVVKQTWKNLEIIIIDDGSPDKCGSICDEYAKKYSNILVIHRDNGGVSSARNMGLHYATGEWVLFLDSDDWCRVDYIEKMLTNVTANNDGIDVIVSSWEIDETNKHYYQPIIKEGVYCERECIKIYQIHMFIPLPKPLNQNKYFIGTYGDPFPANKLYRRENLVQYRIFFDVNSNGVADDNLFNLEYFGHVKTIKYVDSRGWHHRMVENSITHSFKKDRDIQEQYYLRSVKKYCDSHSEINEILDLLFCFNAFFVWFGYVCRVFMNDNMNIKEKKMLIKDFRRIDEIAEMFKTIQWRKFPKVTQILVFFVGKYEMYCLLYIAVKVYFKRHI